MQDQTTIAISGMTCSHCITAVKRALSAIDGVEVRSVELGSADVAFDPARVTHLDLSRAIEDAGYQVIAPTTINVNTGAVRASGSCCSK